MSKIISYAHQKEAFELSKDEIYYSYLMEMGTGKTKVLIDNAAYLFKKKKINGLLVIAPKSIIRNWTDKEIPTHMADTLKRIVLWQQASKKFDKELYSIRCGNPMQLHVFVVNVDALVTDRGFNAIEAFLESHDTLMVIDESTIIKNWQAERTKIAIQLGKKARYRRIMTGTPVTNSPLDIYSQFEFLRHGCLGSTSFYGFRNTYAVLKKRYVNGRKFDEIVGYQRLEQLHKILQPMSYRKLKKECLDLPEKIYQTRYVELSKEQKSFYEQIKEEAMAILNSGEVITAPLVITQIIRLRQALCNITNANGQDIFLSEKNPRIAEIMNILQEAGDQKVIIWSCFVSSIKAIRDAIAKEYGPNSVGCIYGDVDSKTRQLLVEKFQEQRQVINPVTNDTELVPIDENDTGDLKYLVMQPRTAGYGLTLTAASIVVYADSDWSLDVRMQSEDRAHRIGQTKNVTYIDILASGTIDEKVHAALVEKKDLANLVTGDSLREMLK